MESARRGIQLLAGLYLIVLCLCVQVTKSLAQLATFKISRLSEQDSLLKSFTLEELEQYQNIYSREITRLQKENEALRRRAIRDGELFLANNPKSDVADKIMLRLAELYYDQAQDDYQARMQQYDSLFTKYRRGEILSPPTEPRKDLKRPLQIYTEILQQFPQSDLADDALYNRGLLLEETGLADSAFVCYNKLLQQFPNTPLLPDVLMRIGEYYFNPPQNRIDEAITYFNRLLVYRDSPRYDEALYRLGWCYYRRNDYARAISYFTLLVDDITHTMPYDPLQKYSNPSLVEEAIEYIGLCFLEYGGVQKAVAYLEEIGGRTYGVNILKRLGDAYMDEKEDYPSALQTFQTILRLYPMDAMAPAIQNRMVQAYRRMDDQAMAFFARDFLFQNYRPGSEWWQKNESKEVRNRALMYVESALRDNITVLINKAEESGQKEFYRQAVVESRKYLEYFPADSLAAMIHWNMAFILDSRLHSQTEAFAEYIKISQQYMNSKYQRQAAENAVALAHEAVAEAQKNQGEKAAPTVAIHIEDLRAQFGNHADKIIKFREKLKIQPTALSPEEQHLAEAYDNYIMLFPHGSRTPIFLANVGTLYYQHGQFREALKYFNTLLKHFPNSEEAEGVRFAVMESYFGKADFPSTEIVARRILVSEAPEEMKAKARRRLLEAVFLNAELLADDNRHLEAGNEYRRLARENPEGQFVDLAIFNSALEYEKANEFNRAIEAYQYLIAHYPHSPLIYDAQNNLAFDYAELLDYRNAALTYERVAAIHPEHDRARDALYNSGLYYNQIGDLQNALRVYKKFTEEYADDEWADDLAFEVAAIYQRLNDPEKAHKAYQQFIADYPHSPRVVEAHFLRSKYFLENGQHQKAIEELEKAVAGRVPTQTEMSGNEFYTAEAEFALAIAYFREFEAIQFRLPKSELENNKSRKKELLKKIIHHLGNCAAYGTSRVYEATYMIGRAYQIFAQAWEEQQLPPMEQNRKILAQKEIYESSALLYEKAARAFYQGVQALSKLAKEYHYSVEASLDQNEDNRLPLTSAVSDSISRLATKWIDQCKKGLTAVQYNEANVFHKSALLVMDAPMPTNLADLQELDYRYQILQIGAEPLLFKALSSHKKNVQLGDSLQIVSEWVELSKQKIPLLINLLQARYALLAIDGIDFLHRKISSYASILFRAIRNETKQQQMKESEEAVSATLELCAKAMNGIVQLLLPEKTGGLPSRPISTAMASTRDSLLKTIVVIAEKLDTLTTFAKTQAHTTRSYYLQNPSPLFEQAVSMFERTSAVLMTMQNEIIQKAYDAFDSDETVNGWYKLLLLHLIKCEPEQYAGLLNLSLEYQLVVTDSTWKTTCIPPVNWTSPLSDDQQWTPAVMLSNDRNGDASIWINEQAVYQKLGNMAQSTPQRIYFHKNFYLDGLPSNFLIHFDQWTEMDVYFNGYLVKRCSPSRTTANPMEIDVCSLAKSGQNILAIEAINNPRTNRISGKVNIGWIRGWYEKMTEFRKSVALDSK